MVVSVVALGILALWAIFGTIREVHRDGYGPREYDPDYDSRRPKP